MAFGRIIKHAPSIHFVADIPDRITVDNRTYVIEPSMEKEKRKIWYSHVLKPYSISGSACVFMGPLSRHIRKPRILERFFPSYPSCEPLVFIHKSFDLSFIKNHVFRSSPSTNNPSYICWLDRV